MHARQGKKAFIYAICRSYNIISCWFWVELKLEILISNFRFSLSCLVQRSRSLYAAVRSSSYRSEIRNVSENDDHECDDHVFENDVKLLKRLFETQTHSRANNDMK